MVKLDLSNRNLREIPPIPDDITELDLSVNEISEIKEGVFPAGLEKLILHSNKIKELKENVFPPGLQKLDLINNQIEKLKPGVFPAGLKKLYMTGNKIKELKEDTFPFGLQKLFLNRNQIRELRKEVFPQELINLDLNNNQIVELKPGVFPTGLQKLYLDLGYNKIRELREGVFPPGLHDLHLDNNQILELPIHLLNLRRLTRFYYFENPIEHISLPVQRWLDRIDIGLSKNNEVYSDHQNIHNSNIQRSFRSSLENIMKDKLKYSFDECKNILLTSSDLTEQVKREILNYCEDDTEHSIYLITFSDLFHYVMNRILIHSESSEILKILEEEIKDTICKCFTGRMTRLLNVLNGFYDDIQIQISSNEQITNIILILREKYEREELKEKVKEELKERGYEESVIEEWISFIE